MIRQHASQSTRSATSREKSLKTPKSSAPRSAGYKTLLLGVAAALAMTPWVSARAFTSASTSPEPAARHVAPRSATEGGTHSDKRFGFKFLPPKGWSSIAMKTEEAWLTAKYVSDKSYFYTDPKTRWTAEHTPELLLIAFIKENMKEGEVEVEETDEDGVTTKVIEIKNPYKDYEDFLDRTYSGGGFFVDSKEETEVDDVPVTIYTVKVEKLSRNGPKRIVTYIYHTEDIDFAMQVEVLEGEYKKLRKTLKRSHRSFKEIERTEGRLPTSGVTNDTVRITLKELSEGTPKERRSKRVESQKQIHERAIAQLPDDWGHMKSGKDVLILHHKEKGYAKRVGDHAAMFLKWLTKEFEYVGKGEYVRAPIIRVCDSREEEGAFSRGVNSGGSGWWINWGGGNEIVTHKDDSGFIGYEVGSVNRQLLRLWLYDKDRDLADALPQWISDGLYEYCEGARAKGRKLNFRADDWSRDQARVAVAQGNAESPRVLMQLTREEFFGTTDSGGGYWDRSSQAKMLVRFLMSPDARRSGKAKNLMEDYLVGLDEIVNERAKKDNEEVIEGAAPKTEEEEAEVARKRSERWRDREKALMEDVFNRVFGDWSKRDWDNFEKAFFAWMS